MRETDLSPMPLNIESQLMEGLLNQYDRLLKASIMLMQYTHCNEAKMGVTLEIELEEASIPDGKGGFREGVMPRIKHKVKTQIVMTDELKGSPPGGMELVWDSDRQEFFMKQIPRNQTSLFDDDTKLLDDDLTLDEDIQLPFEDDGTE